VTEALAGDVARPVRVASRRSRVLRRTANACFALAALVAVYATVIVMWGDPVTALYEHHEQAHLSHRLASSGSAFVAQEKVPAAHAPGKVELAHLAAAWRHGLEGGGPVGRLLIPRIGVSQVVVQGTDAGQLNRGPGHYPQTFLPGLGKVTAIAGHRTTFGAPFRHINSVHPGDLITFRLPYATFVYRVTGHRIVRSDDWSIIKPHGYDELVLSACHPLYSASHRWVVFARLAAVHPKEKHL
jgi:sortase A